MGGHHYPYELELTWGNSSADMDLSIWSDGGRLNFARNSKFGIFEKLGSSGENIKLSYKPEGAVVRIVHSNGSPPTDLFLYVNSITNSDRYLLSGYFHDNAVWRDKEKVLQIPLDIIEDRSAMAGLLKDKPAY